MGKILMISNHSYMFWQFRRELVSALLDQGHQVTLAVPFGDRVTDLLGLGCKLVDTPMNRRGTSPGQEMKLFQQYRQLLTQEQPDMVLTYSIKPNIYVGFLCGSRNIPFCANVQGLGSAFQNPRHLPMVSKLYRSSLRKAKVVFFENAANARLFREQKITPAHKQCLLSGAGVNLDHYSFQPYPQNDRVHFLYLGRLMREKGVEELLEAVRKLKADGEKFHLDIVGFFEESYEQELAQLQAEGICTFHGFQMEPRPHYGAADCLVMPSYHEGMSNVLLEAAAIGRPIITSDIPGCREAVEADVSGYLCPARDAQALYQAMKKFLTLTRQQREAMGQAGRERMEARFDKNQVVRKTIAAIFQEADYEAVR